MLDRRSPRGAPEEPRYEITLNAAFMEDDPEARAKHFLSWVRRELGISHCKTVAEVLEVRARRAELAKKQRELIAKIDDAYVLAEDVYPTTTAAQVRANGKRLKPGPDGREIDDSEEIMDMVVGHLHEALWLTRKRLKQQELRAPIRREGNPPRIDVDLMEAVHDATILSFTEVVRGVYSRLDNATAERDDFIAEELGALRKARRRRRTTKGRNRIDSGD